MRLTLHTDYGFRVLIYLATYPDRVITTPEVSRAYGISKNHLVRVAHSLRDAGLITIAVGQAGGMSLARPASAIRAGDVVRALEPDMRLVECFDRKTNTCPIAPSCALKRSIQGALAAFLAALDGVTLAEVVTGSGGKLVKQFLPVDEVVRRR